MTVPGPLIRLLAVVVLLAAGVLAAIGGLALRAPGVGAVAAAGLLAGLTAAAIARDAPRHTWRSIAESAALVMAGTVGVLLVVSGTAALIGAAGTVLLLAAVALVGLVYGWRRTGRAAVARLGYGPRPRVVPLAAVAAVAPVAEPTVGAARRLPPVAALSTAALGCEWLRTTAALAGRLDPAARRSIVDRREATLDELERRDPAGFGRWMAGGPIPGSDPADYVRGGPAAGTAAA